MISRRSSAEIEKMRRAGRIVAEVLALVESELRPGVSTAHLDRIAERHILAAGATPSFKGYLGGGRYGRGLGAFPGSICISIDDEVVHGIPGSRTIRDGQVVGIDAGAALDGWHGDAARTFIVGETRPEVAELVDATRLALIAGIAAALPGNHIEDIGAAIEDVAIGHGFGIVRPFTGHGIGTQMHEPPNVPNYRTGRNGLRLQPGVCLAIEPMFTLGGDDVTVSGDGWTVVTSDGSTAAHFEHTIAVTEHGAEILTSV